MRLGAVVIVMSVVGCAPAIIEERDGGAVDAPTPDTRLAPDAPLVDAPVTGPPDAGPGGPTVGGCGLFPPADPWNQDVSGVAVDTGWTQTLLAHATRSALHPDFAGGYGMPINVVAASEPGVPMAFDYDSESDPGPYPFPATVAIEGGTPTSCGGDCHVLVVQSGVCLLWEGYACLYSVALASWHCGSGARFDLSLVGPGQRPQGWTSADAAGLAITPGLVRVDEVVAGHVDHAIRFTMHCTQDGYVYPASHLAVPDACPPGIDSATLRAGYPPMGTRVRLKGRLFDRVIARPGAGHCRRNEEIWNDPRGQWVRLLLPGRGQPRLERRRD